MSKNSTSTKANSYPTQRQYEQWQAEADERDQSLSLYIQNMVEAGRKKFTADVEYDETRADLRAQRNDLKAELDRSRDRIARLEAELHQTEREAVGEFVEQHPHGVSFADIVQDIINSAPERVNRHLDDLEGDRIRHDPESSRFYPVSDDVGDSTADGMGGGGDTSG